MSDGKHITSRPDRYRGLEVGTKYGRLTIVGPVHHCKQKSGANEAHCECLCDCGKTTVVRTTRLKSGGTRSCGCLSLEKLVERSTTHGGTKTRLFWIWAGMNKRCRNANEPCYPHYGGRGITVCQEWLDSFETFRDWALANGYCDDLTIERKDVNGNYEPSNCTWLTRSQQMFNLRSTETLTAFGETKPVVLWARDPRCTVTYLALRYRLKHGWEPERAITDPPARVGNRRPRSKTKPEAKA
jgi:hypothetical protein